MLIQKLKENYILKKVGNQHALFAPKKFRTILVNDIGYNILLDIYSYTDTSKVILKYAQNQNISTSQAESIIYDFVNGLDKYAEELPQDTINNIMSETFIKATLELTGQCNLNCRHCYALPERLKPTLRFPQIKVIIDKLSEMGISFITLTGGECTSHPDFIEIYNYLYDKGFIISFITNGTLLIDRHITDVLKDKPPYFIKISLYGPDALTHDKVTQIPGSFDRTWQSILELKKIGVKFYLSGVMFDDTYQKSLELKNKCDELDIPIYFYSKLIPRRDGDKSPLNHTVNDATSKSIKKLNEDFKFFTKPAHLNNDSCTSTKNHRCGAGINSFNIDCQGNVSVCTGMPKPITNILTTNLNEFLKFMTEFQNRYLLNSTLYCKQNG